MHEVIYLSDDNPTSVGFCQCNVQELVRWVVLALPTVPPCFWPIPPTAPRSPPLDSYCIARAMYMRALHARVREAYIRACAIAYDLPRRLPRLARTPE